MERILGGVLVAIGLMLCVTSNAGAVEIPATAECKATFQELAQSDDGESGLVAYEGSLKQLVDGLVEAGCLSDATPMLKNMKPRPFTDQCAAAASDAEAFWGPLTAKFRPWIRTFQRRVQKPYVKQSRRLWSKIRRAERKGQERRLDALYDQENKMSRRFLKKVTAFNARVRPFVEPYSEATILGVWELVSLRCLSGGNLLDLDVGGPALRVFRQNSGFIVYSMFLPSDGWTVSGASTSATPESTGSSFITRREP